MRKLLDSPWLYFSLAGVLALAAVLSQFRLGPPPKPMGTVEDIPGLAQRDDLNIIFMLIDTLRADHLGIYGYERPTSPNIDRMTQSGIRFANVEAQSSWTKSSMASLWTGLYPQRAGILRYKDGLPEQAVLPAEIFKQAGFATGALYRNSWVGPNFGFAQGFDIYTKTWPSYHAERFKASNPSSGALKGSDLDLTESATEFLAANFDRRFLLYMHYMDVHQYTYDSDSDLFGAGFEDLYDNAIHWVDINIQRLVDALEILKLRDKTIIVIASDHGEGFYEHGFEGHAKGLYREVQVTPWVIWLPFELRKPLVVDAQVANIDIWPTLLELMGLDPLPVTDGRSVLPAIMAAGRGEPVPEAFRERAIFAEIDRNWGAVRKPPNLVISMVKQPYRLIHSVKSPNQDELFDHAADPSEVENVARREPEVAEQLRERISSYLDKVDLPWETTTIEIDEMRLNQLRALGYKID